MADNDEKTADKKVDEDWKRKAREEAHVVGTGGPAGEPAAQDDGAAGEGPEITQEMLDALPPFVRLVADLAFQVSVHLGLVENPVSGKVEKDLDAARRALDVLAMLEEKTRGNLDEMEAGYLTEVLYSLRMEYVKTKG